MKIHDISMTIHEDMMVYNDMDKKKPRLIESANFKQNRHYETDITMNLHTGTHIDAPLHMIEGGAPMSEYAIEQYITSAKVLDLTEISDSVTEKDLIEKGIQEGDFVLLKTKNSYEEIFNKGFVFLEKSGANYLARIGIKGIGTDALGIERSQPDHETHKVLFEKGIIILEGLRLKDIQEGTYQLIALPIKILSTEAAPVRAILIEQ
ncbi:MAG: cyclase family protein [Vallitaleaceae bacterium]|nr:cyclase family protein [Vallitaleaceae bacterium]